MYVLSMFPLGCARVYREMSAHKKTWNTHTCIFSFKNVFAHNFIHGVLTTDECWYDVAHGKFCVHTELKKLEGTLVCIYM